MALESLYGRRDGRHLRCWAKDFLNQRCAGRVRGRRFVPPGQHRADPARLGLHMGQRVDGVVHRRRSRAGRRGARLFHGAAWIGRRERDGRDRARRARHRAFAGREVLMDRWSTVALWTLASSALTGAGCADVLGFQSFSGAGGSSTGSGVAVATGLVPMAIARASAASGDFGSAFGSRIFSITRIWFLSAWPAPTTASCMG